MGDDLEGMVAPRAMPAVIAAALAAANDLGQRHGPAPRRDQRPLACTILVAGDEHGLGLVREVQRTRAKVTHAWPPPSVISTEADIIFSEAFDDLPARIPWLPGDAACALVIVLRDERTIEGDFLHRCTPHATLSLPARRVDVRAAIVMAAGLQQYERRLRSRIDKLDDNLRSIRSVERAKLLIMSRRGLSENKAYHFLRREAMARRIPIGDLAMAIVDTEDLLG